MCTYVVAGLLVIGSLASCSSSQERPGRLELSDGTLVYTHHDRDGGMEMLISGKVVGLSDGSPCLGIETEDGTQLFVLWPPETHVSDDGKNIHVGGSDRLIVVGETHEFGGGAIPLGEGAPNECGSALPDSATRINYEFTP